jgi:SAM-dependent methyltransferase
MKTETGETQLRAWFGGFIGRRYQRLESRQLCRAVNSAQGRQLIQIGKGFDLSASSKLDHHSCLVSSRTEAGDVVCSSRQLPLTSDSVDALVAPHVLELHEHPHDILREAHRVLRPEGHLILSGFTPWSVLGAARALRAMPRSVPWTGRWLSATRVSDWLSLLGFELVKWDRADDAESADSPTQSALRALGVSESVLQGIAGVYTVVGRKKVMWVRPVVSSWRTRRVVSIGLAEPSIRIVVNRHDNT